MKIGISSPAFALEPFASVFDKVAGAFEVWELVADLEQLLPAISEEIRERAPSYDIEYQVHAPFNDLNPAALNPELRKLAIRYLKETITTAANLGIELTTLHPGHLCPSGVYDVDKVRKANLASLREIAAFADDHGVTLALENMPIKHWTLGNTVDELLGMITGTSLGLCFDIGHAHIMNEVDNFLANTDRIYNVHIHDNKGRRDEHLVLGEGTLALPTIVTRLTDNYSGNIIIESNNFEEGLKSKEYLEKVMKSIK